ncbi:MULTISPECIES: diacylglycerol kinase family protein [Flavobacterium]|uniref:Diacylglycerol kinase family protein n=1 Tax=Flavobacterium sedimenticola TaxID=3043286 RepID=A0ABT6XP68_9FLAO|nr:diacylglycerol kinase family protein [Flavobacterium sedimenticola]MDI9256818.1 diacylglycerol kinase family protein [Flavobacterium sedimenticola]
MAFEKDNSFFTGRLKSIGYAFKGALKLITTEHSVMVQFSLAVLMVAAGFYFDINRYEWMMQLLAFGLVLGIESMNTAIEKVADFVHPEFHQKIGFIKDIAAGGVLFAALAAIAVGLLIYVPKFL